MSFGFPAAAGSVRNGSPGPADHGFIAWSFDPAMHNSVGFTMVSGASRVIGLFLPEPRLISKIHVVLMTAGTSVTAGQTNATLYSPSGGLLAQTADESGSWASTGEKPMSLATPYFGVGIILATVWSVFTGTAPVIARAAGTQSAQVTNVGMAARPPYRSAIADTGLTTTPPGTLGAQSTSASLPWVGLS
jgi:hypothetical protein